MIVLTSSSSKAYNVVIYAREAIIIIIIIILCVYNIIGSGVPREYSHVETCIGCVLEGIYQRRYRNILSHLKKKKKKKPLGIYSFHLVDVYTKCDH